MQAMTANTAKQMPKTAYNLKSTFLGLLFFPHGQWYFSTMMVTVAI